MQPYKDTLSFFIAPFLVRVRKSRRLSQEAMSECLRISRRALSNLETGKSLPSGLTLLFLDQLLTPEEHAVLCSGFAQCIKEVENS